MGTQVVSLPTSSTRSEEYEAPAYNGVREEFVEAPGSRNRSGRGLVTGVLLGAGMWAAILAATGVIKL